MHDPFDDPDFDFGTGGNSILPDPSTIPTPEQASAALAGEAVRSIPPPKQDIRHNPDLDDLFAEAATPKAVPEPKDIRHNPDLDDLFGDGASLPTLPPNRDPNTGRFLLKNATAPAAAGVGAAVTPTGNIDWRRVALDVEKCRIGIETLVRNAAQGVTGQTQTLPPTTQPGEGESKGGGAGDHLRQDLLGRVGRTRLGGIAQRAVSRIRTVLGKMPKGKGGGSKPPKHHVPPPRSPKGGVPGGKPPTPPPTGGAAAGGSAGGSAAGGKAAVAGGAAGGAGAAAGAIGIVLIVADALWEVGKAGKQLAEEQLDFARMLAQTSPEYAANMAKLDMGRTFRDVELGSATANTNEQLTNATDRFEESTMLFREMATDFKNFVSATVLHTLADLMEVFNQFIDIQKQFNLSLARYLDKKREDREGGGGPLLFSDWLQQIAREEEAKRRAAEDQLRRTVDAHRRQQP